MINIMTSEKPVVKPITIMDVLEPGMPPKKVRDMLLANLASRFLMADGHIPVKYCPRCEEAPCRELRLSAEFLRYKTRSDLQIDAIKRAKQTMMGWPLYIYGPNPKEGNTTNLKDSSKRWEKLIEEGARILSVDHIQQYIFSTLMSDYDLQKIVIETTGNVVARHKNIFIVISQVSLTSIRDARQGNGPVIATGGLKGAQGVNVEFTVSYSSYGWFRVEITESRRSGKFGVTVPIEDTSGALSGIPTLLPIKQR